MGKTKFSKATMRDAWLSLVPELSASKVLENHQKRVVEVELGSMHEYIAVLMKAVDKYRRTDLTQSDLDKIDALQAEIEQIQEEVKQIGNEFAGKTKKALAKAVEDENWEQITQITAETAQNQYNATAKQRESIRTCEKQIGSLQSKKIDAAKHVFDQELSISDSTGKTGAGTAYSFEDQLFHVKSPRKSLAYSADALYEEQTRRLFVKPLGDGWSKEMRNGEWWFAGFLLDTSGLPKKDQINSRTRLCKTVYTWITVATIDKPQNDMDLLEVTQKVNLRAENGNLSEQYSGGAEYCLRLVDEINKEQKDVGHQVLRLEYQLDVLDQLDEQKAMVEALIDAETAPEPAEAEKDDVKEAEKPKAAEKKAA